MEKPEFIKVFESRIRVSEISSYNLCDSYLGRDLMILFISLNNGNKIEYQSSDYDKSDIEKKFLELDTIFFSK